MQIQNKASQDIKHPTTDAALKVIGAVLESISGGFTKSLMDGYDKLMDDAIVL